MRARDAGPTDEKSISYQSESTSSNTTASRDFAISHRHFHSRGSASRLAGLAPLGYYRRMASLRTLPNVHVVHVVLVLAGSSAALALVACSSSSSPTTATDSGVVAQGDGGTDSAADTSTADAAKAPENDCTTFADRTADGASRSIQWDLGVTGIPERCIKIKAGQVVTWVDGTTAADFNTHPLIIYVPQPATGTAPTVDEATGKATFPTAGTFGFACGIHPSMRGVVVVE